MKITSTQTTPSGQQTTIAIDGETVARFFGPESQEMAGRFNNDRSELERLRAELSERRGPATPTTTETAKHTPSLQQSSRLPWRAQLGADGFWEVWTRADDTPGSQNNYVVAGEIHEQTEAELLASAPTTAAELARMRVNESRLQTELAEARTALRMFVKQYEGNGHDERENRPEMKKARAVLKRGAK